MSAPRVGVLLPTFDATHTGRTPPVLAGARLIEELGFDGAWVGDHLACPAPLLDAVTALGAAAAVTERIALGFSVLLIGLRPPAWTAKQLVTIDALAPGRLRLGVGVGGEFPYEFEAAGLDVRQRGKLLDGALERLPGLLDGSGVLKPAISAMPPVYVGGRGDAALARVARHGDFWMPMWLSPESMLRRLESIEGERPKLAALILVCVDQDQGKARAAAEAHLRGQYGMGLEKVERWTGLGEPGRIAEQLNRFVQIGVEEFVLMPLGPEPLTQIERLANVRQEVVECVYS